MESLPPDAYRGPCFWEQIDARTVHAVEACATAAALRAPPPPPHPPPHPPPRSASTARSTAHPAAAAAAAAAAARRGARRTDLFGEERIAGDGSLQGMHLYSSPPRAPVPAAASATNIPSGAAAGLARAHGVPATAATSPGSARRGSAPPVEGSRVEGSRVEGAAPAAEPAAAAAVARAQEAREAEADPTDRKLWAGAAAEGWSARRRSGNFNWLYTAPDGSKVRVRVRVRVSPNPSPGPNPSPSPRAHLCASAPRTRP